MKTKICRDCKQEKSLFKFGNNETAVDGRTTYCLECSRIRSANYRAKNLEKRREADRELKRRKREADGPELTRLKWREWYNQNRDHRLEYEHARDDKTDFAKRQVRAAVISGKLEKSEICGNCVKECETQAHHEDYSKPLEVTWLCIDCHSTLHMIARAV